MVSVSDTAPDFIVPLTGTNDDIESFTLSENLNDAPIVLTSFPAVFTGTCTTEMCMFCGQMANFEDVGTMVYGISIDTPFTLTEFAEQSSLNFGLISDTNHELVDAYDMAMDLADFDVNRAAKYTMFVVDDDGKVTYAWASDGPGAEPDCGAVEAVAEKPEVPNGAA